jgi:glycosyltransferase involved in cell wall biosynthesis
VAPREHDGALAPGAIAGSPRARPTTWIVVPCFNEERRLDVPALAGLLERDADLGLVLVDDGSTDGTSRVIGRLVERDPSRAVLLRLDRNRGKAEAVRLGLHAALDRGAAVVGYADADLSTPTEELARMAAHLRASRVSALLGSRVLLLGYRIERKPLRHYIGRVFATVASSLALEIPVYDTQCGAKLFRRTDALLAAVQAPFRTRWAFDVELLDRLLSPPPGVTPLTAADLEELPLRVWRDVGGSKLRLAGMLRAGLQLLAFAFRARRARRRRLALAAAAPTPAPRSAQDG